MPQYALATRQVHGVWGGTSEEERCCQNPPGRVSPPTGLLVEGAWPARAFGGKDAGKAPGAAAVPGLAEQLTARELEVLVLLAAGMPNPRIAGELVVTVDTVKSTSATCWASSARPTAPRRSPGPASSA